jgi:hypothetical protein
MWDADAAGRRDGLRAETERRDMSQLKKRMVELGVRVLNRWKRRTNIERRLRLVERISLAPKQSLALIEAEGQKLLVAFASDGAPAFFALQEQVPAVRNPKPADASFSIPLLGGVD